MFPDFFFLAFSFLALVAGSLFVTGRIDLFGRPNSNRQPRPQLAVISRRPRTGPGMPR
jgi:hypothetical protein